MGSPNYWEKTVEYAFVLDAFSTKKLAFAAPMSGLEEHAAGDAIFGADDKLVLVEFKVDEGELATEQSLFKNYAQARASFSQRDRHHFLVFASKKPEKGAALPPLVARTYFSGTDLAQASDCLEQGASQEVFEKYIEDLLNAKHPDGRSSGQIAPERLANVVGVNMARGRVRTVTLKEYARRLFPQLVAEQQATHTQEHDQSIKLRF